MASILIIEDSSLAQYATLVALRTAGYQVDAVTTIAAAEQALSRYTPDVCLLDLILTDSFWRLTCDRIGRLANRPPIIVITSDSHIAELLQYRAQVLRKPITIQLLLFTVQAVVSRIQPAPA